MGVVYDAEDQRLPRRVALKFLSDELAADADAARRFKREADVIASLNHPNICTIYEIDWHEGQSFIAMERLEGANLKVLMARRTLETPEVLHIARQVAEALDHAHGKGIIHRDIKPGNIVVSQDGQVKVLDFGLARRLPTEAAPQGMEGSTIPGRPLGTASYMAPERILQLPLDPRCDLFSLGVVIYEMATGRLPFTGASPGETVTNVLEKAPTPLTMLSPTRPAALGGIVNKLLAKRAADRYQSARALNDDLTALANRKSPGSRLRRWLGRDEPRD
jgi:eukaryotic-like serine/threonine-protein kinase